MDAIWNAIVEHAHRIAAHPRARELVADQKRVLIEGVIRLLEEELQDRRAGRLAAA